MKSLENLIQYQLSEGLKEHQLAEDIGVPTFTIHGILKGRDPKSPDVWKKLARYFHMDVNLLRFGKLDLANPQEKVEDPTGHPQPYRKVPILSWNQVSNVVKSQVPISFLTAGQGMVDTELSGARVFALHVHDDSMEPLFHEGEIILVNPDFEPQPGDYVIFLDQTGEADHGCLRQFKKIQGRYVLHPLNIQYKNTPLTSHQKIVGRVIQVRMNL
jgi:SOS-response transcriptional repressor LexA